MDCLALRKQVLDLSWAKFLIAPKINVTLTPINLLISLLLHLYDGTWHRFIFLNGDHNETF